ncbi:MAG: ABC transporter substrate-binding protein, partial [Candidatus Micrarchaeia archaeon]
PLVGNDKDEHGCIGSAGYSWCEQKQKCIRVWEENCTQLVGSKKGPASDAVVFKIMDNENATSAILSSKIDYYLDSLPTSDVLSLQNDSRVSLYSASSSIYGFYVNPAPAKSGELNPFSIQKVRLGLQYLIDRDAVVDEVFGGLAVPTSTNPWSGHPSYEIIRNVSESYNIQSNLSKANSLITEGMTEAGATKESGIWTYNKKPITLQLFSTNYSAYKSMMNIIATSLETAGFETNLSIIVFNVSSTFPPYSTDPAKLEWHLAPTGWIYYDVPGLDATSIPEMDEGEEGWWVYNNTAISSIREKMKNCKNEAEWELLDRELASAYLNDSTGIWLAAPDSTYAASSNVYSLAQDKFIGIGTYSNIREAYTSKNKTLAIGVPEFYFEGDPWNPVVINNIFMMNVVNSIYDPVIRTNTNTLKIEPFRWGFTIVGSPVSNISVPSDAFVWNYSSKSWDSIGGGKLAKTKVTYDLSNYVGTKWHHGQNITWADVLYFSASTWDRTYDAKKREISSTRWKDSLDSIVGMKINGESLEVYLSDWNVDDESLLQFAKMFQRAAPLEEYAAMDSVVFGKNEFKYQYGESDRNITSLSLVNGSHVQDVLAAAHNLKFAQVLPMVSAGGKTYLTQAELSSRVASLDSWNAAHKHLIINDGSFYFDRYDAKDGSVYLVAFRDGTYPFSPGYWRGDSS